MSNVVVPFGDNQADTATLLLAAAEDLGLDPSVISVAHFDGGFSAPEEVAKKAKVETVDPDAEAQAAVDAIEPGSELPSQAVTDEVVEAQQQASLAQSSPEPAKAPAAKKTAAKKATAKKTAAKKSTAGKGN